MSRYEPANGVKRCPVCQDLIPADMSVQGPHFWEKHGLWGAIVWRWDRGERGRVIAFGITVLVLLTMVCTAIRNLL